MSDPKTSPIRARVLVLVLAADGTYRPWVDSIRGTWGANPDSDFQTLYYYGLREGSPIPEKGKAVRQGDVIICDCVEAFARVLPKTIMAYERVLTDFSFDYLFRCCATSYVEKNRLLSFLEGKPSREFYCGVPVPRPVVTFASGAGYFLSRDLVERVVEGRNRLLSYRIPWNMDDVAVAKLLFDSGVNIYPGALRGAFPSVEKSKTYHYHLKGKGGAKKMYDAHSAICGGAP